MVVVAVARETVVVTVIAPSGMTAARVMLQKAKFFEAPSIGLTSALLHSCGLCMDVPHRSKL